MNKQKKSSEESSRNSIIRLFDYSIISRSSRNSIIRLFDYSIISRSSQNSIIRLFDYSIIRKSACGFTLVEMLVVIGIIAVLTTAAMTSFRGAVAKAQGAKCQELVHNVATALTKTLQEDGCWPNRILSAGRGSGEMTAEVGGELARRKALSLNYRAVKNEETGETVYKLVGIDQCGVVSPWAAEVVKKKAASGSVSLDADVPTGGKIRDHVLRFSVDDDEDGLVNVNYEGGKSVTVRASAAVWCCGRDGKFGTRDDIKSWAKGQEK